MAAYRDREVARAEALEIPLENMSGVFYCGDNLEILEELKLIPAESVNLIYLDPPFNSRRTYNLVYKGSKAQEVAFKDCWSWDEAAPTYARLVGSSEAPPRLRALLRGLYELLKDDDSDLLAYLCMMAPRLVALHTVLAPTGSLYLHCDPTASHYLRTILDAVFGSRHFRSEVVWKRSAAHSDTKQGRAMHGHIHDVLLFYTKSDNWTWNPIYTPYSDSYVGRDYRLVDEDTGRHFRRGDLTAAKPGGDTEYEWRVKKHAGVRERWVADLSNEHRRPKDGWEYKGVRPYKGRYWAYSQENMREFARDGRLRHTFAGMPEYKRYLDEMPGVALQDLWADIAPITAGAQERLGYPTQKPIALMQRIIASSSNVGDVVLDPFCGCGTTIEAAERMQRRWIGIDISHKAVEVTKGRFERIGLDQPKIEWQPPDMAAAKALAKEPGRWRTTKMLERAYPLPDRLTRFPEGLLMTWMPFRHGGGDRGIELQAGGAGASELCTIGPGYASSTVEEPTQADVQRAVRWLVGETDGT